MRFHGSYCLYTDNIVLIGESFETVNSRLEEWRETLESKGLRVSRSKTKYIEYDFGERE